jgi:hypothetical protein
MRSARDFVAADCPQDDERSALRCSPAALESTLTPIPSRRSRAACRAATVVAQGMRGFTPKEP